MPNFIRTTCGTQYAGSDQPPAACAICQDERQYVKATGQQWTTPNTLAEALAALEKGLRKWFDEQGIDLGG
jgi:hypothetical protein